MTAAEALRKALAIERCRRKGMWGQCRPAFDASEERVAAYTASEFHGTKINGTHLYGASLFLDGFTVEELTEAGG